MEAVGPPNQVLQLIGALLILAAYMLLQLGVVNARSASFGVMNLFGAALLAWEAGRTHQYGFLVLEGSWALVSALSLVRLLSQSRRAQAG